MRGRLAAAAVALLLPGSAHADPAQVGYPNSIAATGESITRAFNADLIPFTDAPWNSWSTGGLRSWSHYRRILSANPRIFGRNHTTLEAARAWPTSSDKPAWPSLKARST